MTKEESRAYMRAFKDNWQCKVLDNIASPVETRFTDNSMPMHDWSKYDKPAVFRRLSIYISRKKLERKPCL